MALGFIDGLIDDWNTNSAGQTKISGRVKEAGYLFHLWAQSLKEGGKISFPALQKVQL